MKRLRGSQFFTRQLNARLSRLDREARAIQTHEDRVRVLQLATEILQDLQKVIDREWATMLLRKRAPSS